MEKDIGKISKNAETDIIIRLDDFGGRPGLTIREYVRSERYSGFTKAGTRIPASHFKSFKEMINSISDADWAAAEASAASQTPKTSEAAGPASKSQSTLGEKKAPAKKSKVDLDEMEF